MKVDKLSLDGAIKEDEKEKERKEKKEKVKMNVFFVTRCFKVSVLDASKITLFSLPSIAWERIIFLNEK